MKNQYLDIAQAVEMTAEGIKEVCAIPESEENTLEHYRMIGLLECTITKYKLLLMNDLWKLGEK